VSRRGYDLVTALGGIRAGFCLYTADRGKQGEDRVAEGLCKDLLAGRQQSIGSQQDCERMKLDTLRMQSDSNRSAREIDKHNKMATEGHKHDEKKSPKLMSATEMDK
jgi:hypothetical protein